MRLNPTASEMGRKGGSAKVPKGAAKWSKAKRREMGRKGGQAAARARRGKRE